MTNRHVCDKAPPGWQCLRDAGHDGPCAAAPLTGSGACPDIDQCLEHGCQCKCGPDPKPRLSRRIHDEVVRLMRSGDSFLPRRPALSENIANWVWTGKWGA